jgi:hypothetical protein
MQVNSIVDILAQAEQSMKTEPVDRKRIAIRLFHVHLPKLMAHGIVEYDSNDGTVRYRPGDRIEEVLDALSAPLPEPTVNSGR